MNLTAKQSKFVDLAIAGVNIFLTGKAGTGKSFVLRHVLDTLKGLGKKAIAIAPTGIAATNIDGQTIHSMFSIPPSGVMDESRVNFMSTMKRELLRVVDTYVIDEVSMLRPDLLDGIHWTLRKNGLPGLDQRQVIFVGDLAQLPPILDDNERTVLYQTYDGDTFLYSKVYKKMNVQHVELDEVLRQSNREFIDALNMIREGKKAEYFRQFAGKVKNEGVVLAPHNTTVQGYNERGLLEQPGELYEFIATLEGEAKPQDFNLERVVRVKNGCKIMYLVNSQDNPLRNGTLGTFYHENGKNFIRVGNINYAMNKVIQEKKKYIHNKKKDTLELEVVGSITQMPFKLAYALSIHKSQGLTFDEVTIDLTRPCFQPGQMYVALSRVRTPEGLKILV